MHPYLPALKKSMLLTETVLRETVLDKLSFLKILIDIQSEKPIHFIACKSTANGDCLYNSASSLLAGDESLCVPIFTF